MYRDIENIIQQDSYKYITPEGGMVLYTISIASYFHQDSECDHRPK